jgi:predicted dehydrogenase
MPRTWFSRRLFLRGAVAAPFVFTGMRSGAEKASNRITLGFIGVGTMGRGHLNAHLGDAAVQVVAVCDVEPARREDAKKKVEAKYAEAMKKGTYKGCDAYNDFRDVLGRKDIDAVVIATPDHWHAIPCVEAARAGKHIYCEKPLTHTISEGRKIVEEVAKAGIVFQTGSQQRSEFGGHFRKAVEYIRNGRIGKLKTVRIGDGVGDPPIPCDLPEQEVPAGTDWDRWLGPAPKRGYNPELCPKGIHSHFPRFRAYREYAGGYLADMGAHHFDIAQWALDMDGAGPVKIEPPEKGNRGLKFTYANGVEMFHGADNVPKGMQNDCVFEGTEGTIFVGRGGIGSEPGTILTNPLTEGGFRAYPSNNHRKNWLDCIGTKKSTICTAEIGHRSATVCHLANIGYLLRRALRWDPAQERFLDDAEANKLLAREYRAPWKLG